MRQAITTKYHGPTNTLGSRVSASCEAGRIYHEYEYDASLLDVGECFQGNTNDANHAAAAVKLLRKLDWGGSWRPGCTKHGTVWVNAVDEECIFMDNADCVRLHTPNR